MVIGRSSFAPKANLMDQHPGCIKIEGYGPLLDLSAGLHLYDLPSSETPVGSFIAELIYADLTTQPQDAGPR
jgi:hypothetical protein